MVSLFPLCYRQQRYYFSEWYDSWLPQVQHPHCDTRGRSSRDSQGPFSALQDEVNNFIYDHSLWYLFYLWWCHPWHFTQVSIRNFVLKLGKFCTFWHLTMDWTTYCLSCYLVKCIAIALASRADCYDNYDPWVKVANNFLQKWTWWLQLRCCQCLSSNIKGSQIWERVEYLHQ